LGAGRGGGGFADASSSIIALRLNLIVAAAESCASDLDQRNMLHSARFTHPYAPVSSHILWYGRGARFKEARRRNRLSWILLWPWIRSPDCE